MSDAIDKLQDLWFAWDQGSMIGMADTINAIRPALDEMAEARAEIARLTAELAAARAVTAGVCRYLDCAAADLLAVVTSLYESDWRARALVAEADAARWRKVAPLIERLADDVRRRELIARAEFDRRIIDTVTNLLAATQEPTP